MAKTATAVLIPQSRIAEWSRQAAIVIAATLFIALCARVTIPLPFTPVPLTLQNLGVLLVGLTLGMSPDRTVYDLVRSGGSLDAQKLEDFLTVHPSGIRALLAPARPDQPLCLRR